MLLPSPGQMKLHSIDKSYRTRIRWADTGGRRHEGNVPAAELL